MQRYFLILLILAVTPPHVSAQGLKVPPGFEVVEFADGKLANDIHVMTVDPKGRVIVAARGYIRILVDDDGDGKADRALEFASTPKDGAMGLLWEGDSLYVTGDGGLRRFTSKTGDKADGPSELIRAMKTGGEHSSHAIQRGPDGWLYVLCGNNAGIDKSYADSPTSPIKEPIAGCVLRFPPSSPRPTGGEGLGVRGASCEIVAHGFRNPYGFDFNLDGDLFTFDSDNERCVSLPWYEPTRFYHVIEGRHYGWLNPQRAAFWRRPPYFCDVVAPIATLGRGSPTGVACYRHNQFPPEYHGGFFLCDWTFGKIHFATLKRKNASYTADTRVFLETLGDNGFAPTACAVDPKTGDLYVSIGGRGTRGAVYRIRHPERFKALQGKLAPLPMAKRSLEWRDGLEDVIDKKATSKSASDRLWAMQMTRRHFLKIKPPVIDTLYKYAQLNYDHEDSAVRQAALDVMERFSRELLAGQLGSEKLDYAFSVAYGAGKIRTKQDGEDVIGAMLSSKSRGLRLDGVRLLQRGLGDIGAAKESIGTIWEGYTARKGMRILDPTPTLSRFFPSNDPDLDREIARTLAMIEHDDAKVRSRFLAKCSADSNPIDDIHYLACYARLAGQRADKEATLVAATLLDLDRKIAARKLNRDSNWPLRMRELYVGLAQKDARLHVAMVAHAAFGRPDHALFASTAGFPKERAARIFLDRWQRNKDYALSGTIVQLFDALPADDVLPTIRKGWGETGQDSAFLPLLAKKPVMEDRGKFIDGLNSPQSAILDACVRGLEPARREKRTPPNRSP